MALKNAPHLSEITLAQEPFSVGVDSGCQDPYLPTCIPKRRWDFSWKWDLKISGSGQEFDLDKQPVLKGLFNKIVNRTSLVHPEIHVIWRGLVPPSICRSDLITTCRFTPEMGDSMGLLAQHTHGMQFWMHHIFYPGHSVRVGPGEPLPWAIGFSIPDLSLRPDYNLGYVTIRLTGYFSEIPEYSIHKESEMISIVPMDELVTGFAMSAPRTPHKEWEPRGYKIGVKNKSKAEKIKFLQEVGVDIEALRMVNQLDKTLNLVDLKKLSKGGDKEERAKNAQKVLAHLRMISA
jgi:hypothetical protein